MAGWQDNAIMAWGIYDDVTDTWTYYKVTDHGRQPLQVSTERIGIDKRMADGTLRRQNIAIKRSWSVSWENLPSTNTVEGGFKTADGGMAGDDIEWFYNNLDGAFRMVLRSGSAIDKEIPVIADVDVPLTDDPDFYIVNVMLTDFSKEVRKRGKVDLLAMSVALQEV